MQPEIPDDASERQGGLRRDAVPTVLAERPDASNRRVPSVRTGSDAPGQENRPGGARGLGRAGGCDPLHRRTPKRKRRNDRFRAWIFTENNPKKDSKLLRAIQDGIGTFGAEVRYICYQLEKGENGTPHYQGYIELYRPHDLAGCKSIVGATGSVYLDRRRGTQKDAIKYCTKAETREAGPWHFGEQALPGKRTDLTDLRDAIKGGCINKKRLLEDHQQTIAKYPRFAQTCIDAYYEEGWRAVECILLIGDTRLGKTRWVYDNWSKGDFWRLPAVTSQIWFDGYAGETHVLLDDFSGAASKVSVSVLLQMLDGYICRLPNKGGFVGWKPTHIAITSNVHPNNWYRWKDRMKQYHALAARFTKIMEFVTLDGEVVVTEYTHEEFFTLE